MRTVRVIPCLDVAEGRVKKGVQFLGLVDAGDPVALALRYDAEGADEVVFLDITASSERRSTMVDVVARAADVLFIPLTVGGGIRTLEDAKSILRAGADKVTVNTAGISRPVLISEIAGELGSQCVVVAVDARRSSWGWEVYTHGGRNSTGMDVLEWVDRAVELGAGELLVTSMDRDGTKEGFDLELTSEITSRVDVPVIASGGVGSLAHFAQGALEGGADGLLAASVFHRKEISIGEVKAYLLARGVTVRPA
ncbi:MAG: imidazole glycerol phosphate synthase subunit HisF [Actinobacteria bacterium]|nr:imidazole glycerol phosphate synthase subunit HisF [Actinomycetota bacterium]MCL5447512.1 imidazole glycerol phosphate synthase subunit HisF [Actinomycetota bacterium]